jgi:hypothetical protein
VGEGDRLSGFGRPGGVAQRRSLSGGRALDTHRRRVGRRFWRAWQQWQRSAFARVRSSVRSLRDSAQPCAMSEPRRSAANIARQAGGHWFEPSTAHLTKAPLGGAFLFCKSAVRPASGGNRMATRQSVLRGCKPGRGPQGDPRTTLPAPQQGTRLRLRHRAWQMAVSEGSSEGSSAGLALAGVWSFGATTPPTREAPHIRQLAIKAERPGRLPGTLELVGEGVFG